MRLRFLLIVDREDVEETALLPPAKATAAAGLCRRQQGISEKSYMNLLSAVKGLKHLLTARSTKQAHCVSKRSGNTVT